METIEDLQFKLKIERFFKLALLQSEALMKLSAAIMKSEGVPNDARDEAYEVFIGIQEQLDLLKEIQKMDGTDGN
ncbi:hypothetical protein [Pseudomonas protegens]